MGARLRLAFAFAALTAAAARGATWERIGPEGGSICALASAPSRPAVVYAGTAEFGGVFRSVDRGQTWRFAGAGLGLRPACSLAVDARDPSRLWTVALGSLFTSSDAGAHWEPLATPAEAGFLTSVVAHPTQPRILVVSTIDRILRSTDGGRAWTSRPSAAIGAEVRRLVIDPLRPEHLFAATFAGIYRSPSTLAMARRFMRRCIPAAFYRSTDGGDSWRKAASSWPSQTIAALAVVGRAVYAGTQSGLYQSTNGARSFPEESVRLRGQRVPAILGASFGLLAGGELGLYRSADGGVWRPSQNGLRARNFSHLEIDARTPDNWYLADPFLGVLRSGNAGVVWRRGGREIIDPDARAVTTALVVDPQDSRVYAGIIGIQDGLGVSGGLGVSKDSARSWSVTLAFGCAVADLILPDALHDRVFVDGRFLWTGCYLIPQNCYQFRSDDGGETFGCARDTLPPGAGYVGFDPRTHTLFATSAAGLHRSTDGGDTWTIAGSGQPSRIAFSPAAAEVLYALAYTGGEELEVIRSLDGGATWTAASPGPRSVQAHSLVADAVDPDRLFALGSRQAFVSTDRGDHWQPLGEGVGEVLLTDLAFDPRTPDLLYAASQGGGLMRLRLQR